MSSVKFKVNFDNKAIKEVTGAWKDASYGIASQLAEHIQRYVPEDISAYRDERVISQIGGSTDNVGTYVESDGNGFAHIDYRAPYSLYIYYNPFGYTFHKAGTTDHWVEEYIEDNPNAFSIIAKNELRNAKIASGMSTRGKYKKVSLQDENNDNENISTNY